MRSRVDDAEMRGNILRHANRFGVSSIAIAATYAIPSGAPHIQVIDPTSTNRTVTLPATPKKGDFFIIINKGTGTAVLTVQDSAGTALSPACTPTISEIAWVFWDGSKWWNSVGLGS